MQKNIMLFLSFLAQLFSITAFSQEQVEIDKSEIKSSLLWKISGKDIKTPSYLFGTIHAICSDDYFFTDLMKIAFKETNQLVLEVNLSDPSTSANFQELMMLTDGKRLSDFFSNEEEFNQFADKLRTKAEMDIEPFIGFKPFVLISALSMKAFSCPVTASYEMNLMDMSKQTAMPVIGLETLESQLAIFDKMSDSEIKNLLVSAIGEDEDNHNQERMLIELYKQQDLDGIYTLMSSSKELMGHESKLLTIRNANWVKQLPAILNKNSNFIAVGAAHLPGELGIINLLRKAGYTVEAVK